MLHFSEAKKDPLEVHARNDLPLSNAKGKAMHHGALPRTTGGVSNRSSHRLLEPGCRRGVCLERGSRFLNLAGDRPAFHSPPCCRDESLFV